MKNRSDGFKDDSQRLRSRELYMKFAKCLTVSAIFLVDPFTMLRVCADEPRSNTASATDLIYEAFFKRKSLAGQIYDLEELEPPFQTSSKFPTRGDSYQRAVTALDRFLSTSVGGVGEDPVRRAVLQRDLWAVFCTLAGSVEPRRSVFNDQVFVTGLEDVGDTDQSYRTERRVLQKKLIKVMRQIALTAAEVQSLPDNVSDAIRSSAFPRQFNPDMPTRGFLPSDLFEANSGWVAYRDVSRGDGLVAPSHTRFTNGRSFFQIFLKLPGGQQATLGFLKNFGGRSQEGVKFPAGTSALLLQRMVVIGSDGLPKITPITEKIKIRHFPDGENAQAFSWILHRKELFANRRGGLHEVKEEEKSLFSFETNETKVDYLEMTGRPDVPNTLDTCVKCHNDIAGSGYHTIRSLFGPRYATPDIQPTTAKESGENALKWLKKTYSWGLLQGMWE